jgi:glycerophosphoryl diester phosphodiesterase
MSHLLAQLPYPAIIAHRGASRYAPENTLKAFALAVEQKADGIELDVRLSSDGHLVVFHDATVRHRTNGQGWVARLSLEELRNLDAGQGEKIPTLDEVFEQMGPGILINVELKPILWQVQKLAEKVAQTVERYHMQHAVLCSSFSPPALKALARFSPDIPRGLLLPAGVIPSRLAALVGRTISFQTLHPDFHDVLHGAFAPNHPPAKPIFTYTVNEEIPMRQLFELGVDAIFTDDPVLARRIRGF